MNVKIKDLPKIEDLLKTNIYVYTCDKDLKDKYPLYKSNKKSYSIFRFIII